MTEGGGFVDEKKRILIVEDEKNIVDILRFNMNREGYDTLEAYDGVTGLALARREKPDLIRTPFDEMLHRVMDGELIDAKTVAGVLKVYALRSMKE